MKRKECDQPETSLGKKQGKNSAGEKKRGSCYNLKKHPSATNQMYQPRTCPDLDKYKKKCPPPVEVCKDLDFVDPCAKKVKRSAQVVNEDIKIVERGKPPRCPSKENPCVDDARPVCVPEKLPEYGCPSETKK